MNEIVIFETESQQVEEVEVRLEMVREVEFSISTPSSLLAVVLLDSGHPLLLMGCPSAWGILPTAHLNAMLDRYRAIHGQ